MFSNAKDVNFDHENITKVYLLNAEDSAMGNGHNALILVDDKGCGAFFSYYSSEADDLVGNALGFNSGEMRFKALQAKEVSEFLENMTLSDVISTDGQLENETYTRTMPFDITPEQGSKMLDRAIEFFVEPGRYGLLASSTDADKDIWQCDAVARRILEEGGINIKRHMKPNNTYENIN